VSVRYFLRLTAYTGFEVEARRWNAIEIVLYRGRLYGKTIAPWRLPMRLRDARAAADASLPAASAASGDGALASSAASAGGPTARPSLPQPMTTPFVSTLLFRGVGGSAPLSPPSTPYFPAGASTPGGAGGLPGSARAGVPSSARPGFVGSEFDAEAGDGPFSLSGDVNNLAGFLTKAVSINAASPRLRPAQAGPGEGTMGETL